MVTEVSPAPAAMPQLQSFQKAMALPTVGAAVGQFGALYTRVKGEFFCNNENIFFIKWSLICDVNIHIEHTYYPQLVNLL